ncbi:MAG: DUF2845 domain-containing protein [Nitrospiraceae bacterium]|nr:DUF2845 domain-containing protein [Nitrospiraceae bacterium]
MISSHSRSLLKGRRLGSIYSGLLGFAIPLLAAAPADAVCMSCLSHTGNSYTEQACDGDSKFDVVRKCGKPDYEEESGQVTTGEFGSFRQKGTKEGGFATSTEKIEKLYYNCGQGRFIKVLTFRGGTLATIEIGDRGSGEQKCW